MLRTSLIALGIVMASGGLALAQQSPSNSGPSHLPPKPGAHHHAPPPPNNSGGLQGKGFNLQLGHGRGLRVQCGDEQLKSCIQAAQPLIHKLERSSKHGGQNGQGGWHKMSGGHGNQSMGANSSNSKDSLMERKKPVSPNQSQQSGSSGSQTQ